MSRGSQPCHLAAPHTPHTTPTHTGKRRRATSIHARFDLLRVPIPRAPRATCGQLSGSAPTGEPVIHLQRGMGGGASGGACGEARGSVGAVKHASWRGGVSPPRRPVSPARRQARVASGQSRGVGGSGGRDDTAKQVPPPLASLKARVSCLATLPLSKRGLPCKTLNPEPYAPNRLSTLPLSKRGFPHRASQNPNHTPQIIQDGWRDRRP